MHGLAQMGRSAHLEDLTGLHLVPAMECTLLVGEFRISDEKGERTRACCRSKASELTKEL